MPRTHPPLKPRHETLRRDVEFTDANDHNPTVFEDCPACHGYGRRRTVIGDATHFGRCETCGGTRHSQNRVPYFDNNTPTLDAPASPDGWLTCPRCHWRFKLTDTRVWTGLRHARCGQKIRPVTGDDAIGS